MVLVSGYWACPVKCDACPACPAGKNDCVGVKFEVRKHFTREGAYFTGVLGAGYELRKWLKASGYNHFCPYETATSLPLLRLPCEIF